MNDPIQFRQAWLHSEWRFDVVVETEDGAISSVLENQSLDPSKEIHAVGLPGFPNVHSHAFQRSFAGWTENPRSRADHFWTWRDAMYKMANQLSPDELKSIATMCYCELLEGGYTRVGEFHYVHHQQDGQPFKQPAETSIGIIEAASEIGINLTLLPVLYQQSNFDGAPPMLEQRRFVCSLDGYLKIVDDLLDRAANLAGVNIGIAPHSLRAVSIDSLKELTLCHSSLPTHIHIAEQWSEVETCLRISGRRPIDCLLDSIDVGSHWCLIHATHASAEELDRLVETKSVIGLCPTTEANLGDGIFPASAWHERQGPIAVGSDSNIERCVASELRLLEYAQRLQHRRRNVLASGNLSTAETIFQKALEGGNQALGCPSYGIRVGASADLVSLSSRIGFDFIKSPIDGWTFNPGEIQVDSVWCRGYQLVKNGRHKNRDRFERDYLRVLEKYRLE